MAVGITVSMKNNRNTVSHNNRSEHDLLKKEHINPERTALNVVYVERDIKDVYREVFDQAWNDWKGEYADREKSKYDSYYDKVRTEDVAATENQKKGETYAARQSSRVAHVQKSCWLQIGDVNEHPTDEQCREYAEKMLLIIQEKYPNLVTVSYHLHLDEDTPHIHWNFVPTATGYENGMSIRNAEGRAYEQMGFKVTTEDKKKGYFERRFPTSQTKFLDSLRRDLTGIAKEMGFEIKHSDKSKKSVTHREFKERQDLKKINELVLRLDREGFSRDDYESLEMVSRLSDEEAIVKTFGGDVDRANEFIENMNSVLEMSRQLEFEREREKEVKDHRQRVREYLDKKEQG